MQRLIILGATGAAIYLLGLAVALLLRAAGPINDDERIY